METQSLGRIRPGTAATRNHIVFTDEKGRKIPYTDRTRFEPLSTAGDRTEQENNEKNNPNVRMGIYGWRRRCLFTLIMVLLFLMVVNLALTLWVLKVMDFNLDGMGQLRIVPGGVQLLGQAIVLDTLYASTIKSKRGQSIVLESSRNFSINARDSRGFVTNRLHLGHDRFDCEASSLFIKDLKGSTMLSATKDHISIGANVVTLTGPGGTNFEGAVQTSTLRSAAGKALMLESPTRSLEMRASQRISLESRAGDISATCLSDFRLQSVVGAIHLDAPSIFLPKLKSALPLPSPLPRSRDPHHHDIYQLCVCGNGKLFLAPPHGVCAVREESLICR